MILITGSAGFVGSNLVASLNERGQDDILVCDTFQIEGQWKNLAKRKFAALGSDADDILHRATAVVHLAAITDTQRTDAPAVLETNYSWPCKLLFHCLQRRIPFIYASSAAIYGDGAHGFSDDPEQIDKLRPLSLYGWSKYLLDRQVSWLTPITAPVLGAQLVGLRLFNVYGPNEYHKSKMASVLCQQYDRMRTQGNAVIFGDRLIVRDFVYVEDVCDTILWFLDHPDVSGVFNVGTGTPCSFNAFLEAAMSPLAFNIDEIAMPASLRPSYQFKTQADLTRLRQVGCNVRFRPIEEGVKHYVERYLSQEDRYR